MENLVDDQKELMLQLSAEIVSAYVSKNPISADSLPGLLQETYQTLSGLSEGSAGVAEVHEPAVSIKKSQKHDHLVCLDCGSKFKSLKRHLKASHSLSPMEYRVKWGLSADYPMVAPAYATKRSELAKVIGLGRKA